MKHRRSRQFLERLIGWYAQDEYRDLSRQPFICFTQEISIEEAKRMFNFDAHPDAIGVRVGHTVYSPIEMEVDPWPKQS